MYMLIVGRFDSNIIYLYCRRSIIPRKICGKRGKVPYIDRYIPLDIRNNPEENPPIICISIDDPHPFHSR